MSKQYKMALINYTKSNKKRTETSVKKIKLKDEIGMAGSKSTQTRFVRHKHNFAIHPYACFLRGAEIMQLNQN